MPRPDARVGTELGSYRIEALLGRGGMGVVYRAEHLRLRRKVALKLLAPEIADEEDFRARFLRESQLAASIDHPNIIPIYEAGEAEGEFFLAMRYVDGTDLASRLKAGPLEPAEAVAILAQVASALDAAHAAGLVHRDVKPGNVLLAAGGEEVDHVYLTDFGLTKRKDSRSGLTRTGTFIGSLEYIAPEQIEGREVDGSADLYALGAVTFHCLTGHPPFERDTEMALLYAHVNAPAPSATAGRPDLPHEVDAVLARAMAKEPAARFAGGREFIRALRDALGVRITETRPIPTHTQRIVGRDQWPILAAAAVGVLLIGAMGLAFARDGSVPTATPTHAAQATPSPTPTSTAFPNTAEQELLTRLPREVARNCVRTPEYAPQGYDAVYETRPTVASVRCDLGAGGGANMAWFQEYSVVGPDDRTNAASFVLHRVAAVRGATSGDCARDATGLGTWSVGGSVTGAVACYQPSGGNESWIWWTYDTERTLARAMRTDLNDRALYRWWQSVAPFVRMDQ